SSSLRFLSRLIVSSSLAMFACRLAMAVSRSRCSSRSSASLRLSSAGSTGSMARPLYTPARRGGMPPRRRRSAARVVLAVVAGGRLDLVLRPQEHRHPLVQRTGLDVEDPAPAVGGRAAGL